MCTHGRCINAQSACLIHHVMVMSATLCWVYAVNLYCCAEYEYNLSVDLCYLITIV